MKRFILLLVFIPLVFACSSDSDSDDPIGIGDIHEGGIVYYVNASGGGMMVSAQDIGIGNWYEAENMSENNSTGGNDDWYLPNIYQLQTIYDSVGQGGGNIADFEHNKYWSSTSTGGWGDGYWAFHFGTGESFIGLTYTANARVRAVRSFD